MKQSIIWLNGVIFSVGIILLIGTWYLLFLWLMAMTESWLVPWDTWGEPVRPPVGTSARTVNDFFESGFGSYLPALIIIVTSLGLFTAKAAFLKTQRALLPWLFAVSNFIFVLSSLVVAFVGWQLADLWLSQPRPEIDVGYHRTWPMIVMTIVMLAFLMTTQARVNLEWRILSAKQQWGLLIISGIAFIGVGWFFLSM